MLHGRHRPLRDRVTVATLAVVSLVATNACSNDGNATGTTTEPNSVKTQPGGTTSKNDEPPESATATVDRVGLEQIATLDSPTALAARPGSDDLYVAERSGSIRRLHRDGREFAVDDRVVLDLTDDVADVSGERGLLGVAFSPDGAQLFVSYTDGSDDGASVVDRYDMTGNAAVHASRREVLRLQQPFPNHNGGNIAFGPDGMLYLGFGDGGSQGDPSHNGQDPTVLLGKVLRLDVTETGAEPYAIPPDNPFADNDEGRPEIWISGVRNPWRFSFDRTTGDLWIGDVGGSDWEEIDHLQAQDDGTAGRGVNLGWSLREGRHDTDKPGDRDTLVDPVFEYDHGVGSSVIGGYVYRGVDIAGLDGNYVFSDLTAGRLWALTTGADGTAVRELATSGSELQQVVSFGEDQSGELYVLELSGAILRVTPS